MVSYMWHTAAVDTQGVLQHIPTSPPGHGGHSKSHSLWQALLLFTVTRSRDCHPVWSLQRGAAGPPGRSAGGEGCPPARLPAGVGRSRHACRDAQVSAACLLLMCGCCRTAGISRSEQVANSSSPPPGAAFGQETLGTFAGFSSFDLLGSFLWPKGLSLLHPHILYERRPCIKPGFPFAVLLLLWASLWGTS